MHELFLAALLRDKPYDQQQTCIRVDATGGARQEGGDYFSPTILFLTQIVNTCCIHTSSITG